jgi:ankyrin repeat protein
MEGKTALTLASRVESAAHAEVVRVLLENGADPHMKQSNLCTSIFLAAECGNPTSMQYLLTHSREDPDERKLRHADTAGHGSQEGARKCHAVTP